MVVHFSFSSNEMVFVIKNNSGKNIKKIIITSGFVNLTHENLKNKDSVRMIANLDKHKYKEGSFSITTIKEIHDTTTERCCYFSKFLAKVYYSKYVNVNILPNKIKIIKKE